MNAQKRDWIEDIQLKDVEVKWPFSHIDGRADRFNEEGQHDIVIILPEASALELEDIGWGIKKYEGREEGDEPEYTLKANISYKIEPPRIYLLKVTKSGKKRRIPLEQKDLKQIRRSTTAQVDLILNPSFWVQPGRSGVSAYVKEMYVHVKESTLSMEYEDYEEIAMDSASEGLPPLPDVPDGM